MTYIKTKLVCLESCTRLLSRALSTEACLPPCLCVLTFLRPSLRSDLLSFPDIDDLSHSSRVTFSNRLQTGFPRSILSLKYWCAWSLVNQEVTCLGISKISHSAGLIMTIHHVCEAKFLIQSLQCSVASVFLALAFWKCALCRVVINHYANSGADGFQCMALAEFEVMNLINPLRH